MALFQSVLYKTSATQNRQSVVRRNGKFFHEIGMGTEAGYLESDKVKEIELA